MLLVAGVGYPDLGDLSFGPIFVDRSRELEWPRGIEFEDLSYNPIAVVEWLRDQEERFERAIVIGAAERGRQPGSLAKAVWAGGPRSVDAIQGCVAEAVTGTISLENLLVIGGYFGVLPRHVLVLELEPCGAEPMSGLTQIGEERLLEAVALVRAEASAPVGGGNGHFGSKVVTG
jgi:Ni,Fe-hydrogenase maturation factor